MFPVLKNTTYLNTASSGILSESLHSWRANHDLEFLNTGSNFRLLQAEFLERVKDTVATFFNGDRRFTYLINNFSSGFHTLLNGLPKEHRFLLLENEFPAVYYPIQSKGFATEIVAMGENIEERIVESIAQFKPSIFAFSIVQYTNGLRLETSFLEQLKERFPELILIADGTQFCGTETFSFMDSPVDAMLASGYKWMLGGYGNGIVLLKEQLASCLYTDIGGAIRPKEVFLAYKDKLTLRFEPGHLDTFSFGSLQESLLHLKEVGMQEVEHKIKSLANQAMALFAERGLLDNFIPKRSKHSSIFRLNIHDEIVSKIQAHNIIGTVRGKGIRISFHYYNQSEDLQHLITVLDDNG